jgi:GNAT superfamily N-acetyltransferase
VTIGYSISLPVRNAELNALFRGSWPERSARDFAPVLSHSLQHVCAYAGDQLVGFVNVAWNGDIHAFLIDPTVHPKWQWRGLGTKLVRLAAQLPCSKGVE